MNALLRLLARRRPDVAQSYTGRHRWDTPRDPWAVAEALDPMTDTVYLPAIA